MTLFGSLSIGAASINVNQLALSVVGNNISNAGTPGYVREELRTATLPSTRYGSLNIGSGTSAISTQQQIDRFLRERTRQSSSSYEAASAQSSLYERVQGIFNELGDQDISSSMTQFFSAIQDLANRPNDESLKDIVTKRGLFLTGQISGVRAELDNVSRDITSEVELSAKDINQSLESVRELNRKIVEAEAGSPSDAGALRSKRDQELANIAKLVPIQVYEQESGAVSVLTDGDYLLFNGSIQEVEAIDSVSQGVSTKILAFKDSQRPLPTTGGRIGGIQDFRDNSLVELSAGLDRLASNLIYEFNRIHSSGQGTEKFTSVEGTYRVQSSIAPLNSATADLPFPPKNGSFDIKVTDPASGLDRTYKIDVDLDGLGSDDSLQSLATKINTIAFGGATVATVTPQNRLRITAPTNQQFSFGNDTSGVLASVGINSFFTGRDSRDISINTQLIVNKNLLATSTNGKPGDNTNALALAQLSSKPIASLGGQTLDSTMTSIVRDLGTWGKLAQNAADVTETYKNTLEAKDLSITGVNIDEEAIKMIKYQRSFQASARYISTINDLLTEVINIIR